MTNEWQAGSSSKIEDYLGFPTGISGGALAGRAFVQAQKFGANINVAARARRLHNITLHTRTQITALEGVDRLESVTWRRKDGAPETRGIGHVFLMTGAIPNTR